MAKDDACSDGARSSQSNSPIASEDENNTYHIKWIDWGDEKTAIITQNKNGPCPLLAIFNVLLLSKRITLSTVLELISSSQIIDYIGSVLYDEAPPTVSDEERLNYEQNRADALAVLFKLQTGIDVNVQFKSASSFECTSEITVFDVLRIPLYHGWLPDPQDEATHSVLSPCSYNLIVDKIIRGKDTTDERTVKEGLIAEEFLNSTASQLTCHGVVKILETMEDRQLGVFFRNNHFSTLYKKGNELFTLVTDQGFLSKPNIVWETLSNVQGDTNFTDSKFLSAPPESPDQAITPEQQLEQDSQLAQALSFEEEGPSASPRDECFPANEDADRQLAEELQREYDQQVAVAESHNQSIEPRSGPSRSRDHRQQRHAEQREQPGDDRSEKCCVL